MARALMSSAWRDGARVLKREGGAEVLAGESVAGPVVVKSMRGSGGIGVALSRLLRRSRLERECAGGERLARAGIDVAPFLALWRWRDERGDAVESLAMRRIEGPTLLQAMADPPADPAQRIALARAAGGLVARMLAAGLFNRDQKPSNIIVQGNGGGGGGGGGGGSGSDAPRLVLLDPVGVRRPGLTGNAKARRRMLFSLIVEPIGCGLDVPMRWRLEAMRAALGPVAAARGSFAASTVRADFRAIDQMLFDHGDPTPSINPLGDAGGIPGNNHNP